MPNATSVQRRRGSTAQHSGFTGSIGEITVDTQKLTTVVHDGVTPGGFPQATEARMIDAEQDIATLQASQTAGHIGFQTKALMDADLAHPENTLADVTNDSTAGNNGTYIKVGASGAGSWLLSSYDRVALIEAADRFKGGSFSAYYNTPAVDVVSIRANVITFSGQAFVVGVDGLGGGDICLNPITSPVTFTFSVDSSFLAVDLTLQNGTINGLRRYDLDGASVAVSIVTRANFDPSKHLALAYYRNGKIVGGPMWSHRSETRLSTGERFRAPILSPYFGDPPTANVIIASNYITFTGRNYFVGCNGVGSQDIVLYPVTAPVTFTFVAESTFLVLDLTLPNGTDAGFVRYDLDGASVAVSIVTRANFDPSKHLALAYYRASRIIAGPILAHRIEERLEAVESQADQYSVQRNDLLRRLLPQLGTNYYAFLHIGDAHQGNGVNNDFVGEAIALLNHSLISAYLDFAVFNGDLTDGWIATKAGHLADAAALIDQLAASGKPILVTLGNHDDNAIDATAHIGDLDYYNSKTWRINKTEQIAAFIAPLESAFGAFARPAGCAYYYRDNDTAKVRMIFLDMIDLPDTDNPGDATKYKYGGMFQYAIRDAQLEWLAGTALNFSAKAAPTDWVAVVIMHARPSRDVWYAGEFNEANWLGGHAGVQEILKNYILGAGAVTTSYVDGTYGGDFSYSVATNFFALNGGAMKLAGVFCGHEHADVVYPDAANGFNEIVIVNAYPQQQASDTLDGQTRRTYYRSPGTQYQSSLDVVVIDLTNSRVFCIKYGAGSMVGEKAGTQLGDRGFDSVLTF